MLATFALARNISCLKLLRPFPPSPLDDAEAAAREREAQAIRGLAMAYSRMREEIGKVIVGQRDVVDQLLIATFQRRAQLADRSAGVGQDAAGQHAVADHDTVVPPHSVHARLDAVGHHRN